MDGLMSVWMEVWMDGWMEGCRSGVGERGEGRASRAAAAATSPLPDGVSE